MRCLVFVSEQALVLLLFLVIVVALETCLISCKRGLRAASLRSTYTSCCYEIVSSYPGGQHFVVCDSQPLRKPRDTFEQYRPPFSFLLRLGDSKAPHLLQLHLNQVLDSPLYP